VNSFSFFFPFFLFLFFFFFFGTKRECHCTLRERRREESSEKKGKKSLFFLEQIFCPAPGNDSGFFSGINRFCISMTCAHVDYAGSYTACPSVFISAYPSESISSHDRNGLNRRFFVKRGRGYVHSNGLLRFAEGNCCFVASFFSSPRDVILKSLLESNEIK